MTPDSEHWDQLQALFHLAEASPNADADQLDELLRSATDDADLRARAKALIEAGRRAQTPVLDGLPTLPDQVGPYTIRKHLGTGGIGSVYLVERQVGGAVQRSALKMLSRSAGGAFFAERFAREQYILASLQHEHITRMLDAGVSDTGQAYLVMEYVDGVHLDRYCDERQLGVPERLKLFLEVCAAISYAHQNLVVHLDLKPSNILVTNESGAVKVLDFGTSKLIQPDSLLTTTVMATPAYASPEQLLNEPVTTVCDVYALGAILFELLSGRRPNQDSSVAALIERSMKEFPPEPITEHLTEAAAGHRGLTQTRLRSLLSGDLATIVAKCLNPRPKDRYATVDALIDDVRRYQGGRPIHARPQTTTYRLGKFIRRNRFSVSLGVLAVLALAACLCYAAWRQHQAVREARRALQMQTFMVTLFELANPNHTGKPLTTVPELLDLGMKVVPTMIQDPADRRAAQLSLVESMSSGGDYKEAEGYLTQLVADANTAGDLPVEAIAESDLSVVEDVLGHKQSSRDHSLDALKLARAGNVGLANRIEIQGEYAYLRETDGLHAEDTLRILEENLAQARAAHLPDNILAVQAVRLGSVLQSRGRLEDANVLFAQSQAMYQRMPYATCDQGLMFKYMGFNRSQRQDYQGALVLYRQAYDKLRECSGEDSLKTLSMQSYITNLMVIQGRSAEVIPLLEASLPHWRKAVGPESLSIAAPLLFLTRAYNKTGQFDKAESMAETLLKLVYGKLQQPNSTIGVCEEAWAIALAGQKRYPEAIMHAHLAVNAFPVKGNPGEVANLDKAKATLASIERQAAGPTR